MARWSKSGSFDQVDLFLCERAANSIHDDKVILSSYQRDKVLPLLPYSKNVYVRICPLCISRDEFDEFKVLVERGAVLPVLYAPYSRYPEELATFLLGQDHISTYEYNAYRYVGVVNAASSGLCAHCLDLRKRRIKYALSKVPQSSADEYEQKIKRFYQNLYPFVFPDFELIDVAASAIRRRDALEFAEIFDLSEGVYRLRTAQALNGAVAIDEDELAEIPSGVESAADDRRRIHLKLRKFANDGLRLRIPLDVKIQEYIEIAQEAQVYINQIISIDGVIRIDQLQKTVAKINNEIEALRKSTRYAILEAGVAFFSGDRGLIASSLVAAALGISGNFIGCGAATAVVGAKIAKRRGLIKESAELRNLKRVVMRDLRPHLDRVISSYAGVSPVAVGVLSLRRRIERAKAA